MKVAESIAVILILLGLILILSGLSQGAPDTMAQMINGQEVNLNNKYSYGLNMREFLGIICLIAAMVASIAAGGKTTVVMGGLGDE